MIGIIIFYLVSVHLALGMLVSLTAISQRALGEKFFRFSATIGLALLVLAQIVYRLYSLNDVMGPSDSKVVYWRAHIDSSSPWLWVSVAFSCVYLLSLPFRKYGFSRLLLFTACFGGGIALVRLASGLASQAIPASIAIFVFPIDFFLSALALGSVTICMVLGHWYLVTPGMSVNHLKITAGIFIATIVARVVLGSYTSVLIWKDLSSSGADLLSNFFLFNMLFFSQRILFGLILPLALSWMIWQTVKIRSTQSATGILYVAVVFILFGESLSRYILVSMGYPL